MKKKIYFVQANISCNDLRMYLPYAVGCLIAYAMQFEDIRGAYETGGIFFKRESPELLAKSLSDPFLVCFSCSTWNMEYNRVCAAAIKKEHPGCLVLFGGHNITEDVSLPDKIPEADYFIFGEGEEPLCALLRMLNGKLSADGVPNLIFRAQGKNVITKAEYDFDITDYPSPYLTGLFEPLLMENPDVSFDITMETNRGCPFGCSYCDWSSSRRVRCFSMDRVKGEIDWMAAHKISYCMPGDANFGILDRDVEIAEYLIKVRSATGYPGIFKPCYAKKSTENIYKIGVLLNANGADKGVTISSQSASDCVLGNIGRSNIGQEQYRTLMNRFAEKGIPTYTEFIIGLPGETKESFCRGLCSAIENGQNNSMTVYMCYVFPGSPMSDPGYKKKYGIRTTRMPINNIHYVPDFNGIPEYYDVVTATDSMSFPDIVDVNVFSSVVQCFHHLGLLRCFAVYCHRELGVSFYDFYSGLMNYVLSAPDSAAGAFFLDMKKKLEKKENGEWCYIDAKFTEVGWLYEEGAFLVLASQKDRFFDETEEYLRSFGISGDMFEALLDYQKEIIRLPGENGKTILSEYDLFEYFRKTDGKPPERRKTRLDITFEKELNDWRKYAIEAVWHGKRNSATLVTNSKESIKVTYEDQQ